VNPTNVAFGYRVDGGAITTLIYGTGTDIVKNSLGNFHVDIDTTGLAGTWVWEWQSTGVGQASTSGAITVTSIAMSLLN
jgi:hypothetical protein